MITVPELTCVGHVLAFPAAFGNHQTDTWELWQLAC